MVNKFSCGEEDGDFWSWLSRCCQGCVIYSWRNWPYEAVVFNGPAWKQVEIWVAGKSGKRLSADVVINGGDMLPWNNDPFRQGKFIGCYLNDHFSRFNSAEIYYLCYPGNDDLRIFDQLFEETCNKYPLVMCLAQRTVEVGGYEFAGMNWVVDYPFQLKDRCRMDTDDYTFDVQFGKGVLSTP